MTVQIEELLKKSDLTYEEMQLLAANKDPVVRMQLATRRDLRPEILYYLAEDDDFEVRQVIAQNPSTPVQADLLLASDDVEVVRLYLTEKIARLAPDTTDEDRDKIQNMTHEALMVLSQDQATKVRQILSEILKDVIDAPKDVIMRLAQDLELVVSGPVLQYSPVLTDDDLLEIISSSHSDGALNAIAKRSTVSEVISEAVISKSHESAIADLLNNEMAQIREDTLDMLAEQGSDIHAWHRPLTRRPKLSKRAATKMAEYLAEDLLEHLQNREDLPDDVIASVKEEVQKRLNTGDLEGQKLDLADPYEEIEEMSSKGELTPKHIEEWLSESKELHVMTGLSVLSKMRRMKVKKIIASQSGKGIMALSWRAGMSAQFGETLQLELAKVPAKLVLNAKDDGEYPLNEEELSWHLEMFGND